MAFSGALTLTDLNDYLGPSQACIKPLSGKDAPSDEPMGAEDKAVAASTEIAIDADGTYYEARRDEGASAQAGPSKPRERSKLETAEISLNDCLACSGCVTSAETVLIGLQSVDELRKAIAIKGDAAQQGPTHLVASISPQSLASLSAKYSSSLSNPVPLRDILARIEKFLIERMQFDVVTDTSFARHLSLQEQAREYEERREASLSQQHVPNLPMLASACPGWICYAEKTHGELLPLISKTRSPQQMAGLMAKQYLIQGGQNQQPRIYHATVMPCYDKKLEASRQDFFDDVTQTRDVDLVITTGELEALMKEEDFPIVAPPAKGDAMVEDTPMTPPGSDSGKMNGQLDRPHLPSLLDHVGSSSGSYLFDLIERAWLKDVQRLGATGSAPDLNVKIIRSADYTEYVLRSADGSGKILFKGAQCYGFRNLQNLVRKVQRQTGLKSKKSAAAQIVDTPNSLSARRGGAGMRARGRGGMVRRGRGGAAGPSPLQSGTSTPAIEDEDERTYDFVEVMACPGGCVNGGGQLRPPGQSTSAAGSSAMTSRTIATDVTEAILDGVSKVEVDPEQPNAQVKSLDPEGFTHGWSTPPRSVTSGFDELSSGAQTPTSTNGMQIDESEEPVVAGWKGTSKEWVRRVEFLYWKASQLQQSNGSEEQDLAVGSVHQAQALGLPRDAISGAITRALSAAQLRAAAQSELDALADHVVASMCQSELGRDDASSRSQLMRTDYRALQDEAVSGLAVQW